MKKKKKKTKKTAALPVGRLTPELVIWDFSENEDIIRHNALELARVIQLSYNLNNFGLASFGMEDGNEGDE